MFARIGVFLIERGDAGLLLIAFVQVKTVTERHAFTGGNGQITRACCFLFKIMDTKWIGRKQSIIAHMPPGWVARVFGGNQK